jgi:LacI family transcriptional regulator
VATLRDVAIRAGVSHATVARVIHENGYVAEATRARVEAALRESGYRLNAVAQGLRRQRMMTLGHILHGILPNPFFAEVAIGVEQGAAEQG